MKKNKNDFITSYVSLPVLFICPSTKSKTILFS